MAVTFDPCLCSLATQLGESKGLFLGLIDKLVLLVQALKTTMSLFNLPLEDELRRIKYQTELQIIEMAVAGIQTPFQAALAHMRILADCDPVAALAANLKKVRDLVLSDFYERQDEVDQYLMALDDKAYDLEFMDKLIDTLQKTRDALDQCGA